MQRGYQSEDCAPHSRYSEKLYKTRVTTQRTVFIFAQAIGLGNATLDLAHATTEEFYGELALFRESAYPGMMLGQEPDGSTWKDYIGFVDGRLRFITVPTSLTMKWNR